MVKVLTVEWEEDGDRVVVRRAGTHSSEEISRGALARKAGHVPLGTFDKELGKLDDVARV